jgi:tRNA wybutosine-synthesizing protein 2
MKARAVPLELLSKSCKEDWVDTTRRPYAEGNEAWVPVKKGEPYDRDIPERSPYEGRGFFCVGNVAVIHGKKPGRSDVEEIVRFRHLDGVLWIESLNDITRTPRTEVLWGEVGEVEHHENGYAYIFDPRLVMFSQGNHLEKMRMAGLVEKSGKPERVADMFAGIGYFSIPMAGSGAHVHAMEINPVAFDYLNRSIERNGLECRVSTSLGDCRDLLTGTYDRIVMGHFDAITILPSALAHSGPGTIVHLHSIGPVEERIREVLEGSGFSATISVHKVKKYRPHAWHVVQDVTLT